MSIKTRILLSILGISVIGLAIIFFVIVPTADDIIKINRAVYLERVDLEKKYQRGMLLKKAITNFQEAKPLQSKLVSVFLIAGNELEFITALEKIAADNSLEQTIKMQPAAAKTSQAEIYGIIPLDINLTGQYPDIVSYLNDLESLIYQVNINSISLNRAINGEIITAGLKGEIYVLAGKD